jgi:hypothetical protein
MKLRKTGIVLLSLLLAAMAIIPIAGAADGRTLVDGKVVYVATASQAQVDKINELWGRDITIGEYLTQVHPSLLENIPADARKSLFEKKWHWPTPAEMEKRP